MTRPKLTEKALAAQWQRQGRCGPLRTVEGEGLYVLHTGVASQEGGPDFQRAVIATQNGELLKGDVELHVHSRDWQAHGHDRDERYDGVVLHVVASYSHQPTLLSNGRRVPVLPLEVTAAQPLAGCEAAPAEAASLMGALEEAGRARFLGKAASFEGELACRLPEQVLYQGLLEALGYSQNKEPFRELAQALPWETLSGLMAGKPPEKRVATLEALLFAAAGLLPGQRRKRLPLDKEGKALVGEMERVSRALRVTAWLTQEDWRFFGVRPDNCPPRRIVGASHLLARHSESLLELVTPLKKAGPSPAWREMETSLTVAADGYWADHWDFGRSRGRKDAALIGQGRAREMTVNVLLPFAYALGQASRDDSLSESALWAYLAYPPLGDNAVLRLMRARLGITKEASGSACRQQGLLHLNKLFCTQGRCDACPILQPPA